MSWDDEMVYELKKKLRLARIIALISETWSITNLRTKAKRK